MSKIIKARITTDAKKLWSCPNFSAMQSEHRGKLPTSAGKEILLESPGETPSSFCNAKRSWRVAKPPEGLNVFWAGKKVCEHQVDIDEEEESESKP